MTGLEGGSCPTTGTAIPAALGVALHACIRAGHPLCPETLPGSPAVRVPHKMHLLSSSPGLGAPAPHQPRGLQGLILHSRDRAGSAIALTTLRGFPQRKVGVMLRARACVEVTGAGPAALLQPSHPQSCVKPCETHLSSRLVATQTLNISWSGMG